ncbi:MAG TPA: hypothetical protein VF691_18055 [Cytophagaceae bacterium]|jgi:hypothetical protein
MASEGEENQFMSKQEYYNVFRGRIEYANNLINQRIIWLVISQSFFFSAYAMILNAPEKAKNPLFEDLQLVMHNLLPIAAITSALLSYIAIAASVYDIPKLSRSFDEFCKSSEVDNVKLPHVMSSPMVNRIEMATTLVLPSIFAISWAIIIFNAYF